MWFSPGIGIGSLKRLKDLILPFLELTVGQGTDIRQFLDTLAFRSGCNHSSQIPRLILSLSPLFKHTLKVYFFFAIFKTQNAFSHVEVIYQKDYLETKPLI